MHAYSYRMQVDNLYNVSIWSDNVVCGERESVWAEGEGGVF